VALEVQFETADTAGDPPVLALTRPSDPDGPPHQNGLDVDIRRPRSDGREDRWDPSTYSR
jgi:hypothetical protein